MVTRRQPILLLIASLFIMFSFAGCKGKGARKPPAVKTGPAAEAKQTLPTPTLAPSASDVQAKAEEMEEETAAAPAMPAPQPIPVEPKGPITLMPDQQAPAGAQPLALPPGPVPGAGEPPASAGTQPQTPALAQPQAAPPGAAPTPAPPAGEGPQATAPALPVPGISPALPSMEPVQQGAVASMPAPALAPPQELGTVQAQQVPFAPQLVRARTDLDIIIDASGSMAALYSATNKSKLDLVKEALYDVIFGMGQQQSDYPVNLGIRTFGSLSPSSDGNRQDSNQVVSMGAPDLGGIRAALDPLAAQGLSPIAFALTEAMNDFPTGSTADRVIVLVADGADNTEGNPCDAVVSRIEAGPVKTTIHVIAFDVSPADLEQLECVAKRGDGMFFLARNEGELRSALDQAVNSTIPYNLKLTAQAGSTPIPFTVTVLRAGTEQAIRQDKSFGTKLLRLEPGSYDLLIEYAESPERRKPSKLVKGVEILATTKVEQTIAFDLGQASLTALGNDGAPAPARFLVTRAGSTEPVAQFESQQGTIAFFLSPGIYDMTADLMENQIEGFSLVESGVEVKASEAIERTFRFQKGTVTLRGVTTQNEAIPFIYQVYRADRADQPVASGALPSEGGAIPLAPGAYDIIVIGADPKMAAAPRTKISGIEVVAAVNTDIAAVFEMGTMKLSAVDGKDGKIPALFVVRDKATQIEMARAASESGDPVVIPIPPGTYDVVASSLKSNLEPKPSVPVSDVVVTSDKPAEQVIKFVLGTLKLRGRNAKEQPMQSQFTIYKAASDEIVTTAPPSGDWTVFDLAPGTYDALAVNTSSEERPQPMIWLRDLKVADGQSVSHEAIFTAGKLKIIGRGPNNQVITCTFKVFQYGKDRELINGVTGSDWEVFEIQPGKYYLEAGYHDDEQSVMLKQWVNISVGENEVVEVVLRF